jgi:hypothetical protein
LKIPSGYAKEAMIPSQQELPKKPRLFRTPIVTEKPSNYCRIFLAYSIALPPTSLKGVSIRFFIKKLSETSTLQRSTAACENNLHL